ncbi:hypothetical protein EBI01_18870 [Marinomonas rhizomae]|nr:hypothetical protein EBI01_18870 [Marinomonas rhizomae]
MSLLDRLVKFEFSSVVFNKKIDFLTSIFLPFSFFTIFLDIENKDAILYFLGCFYFWKDVC